MHVLHVGKFYPPVRGGMERALQLLCEEEQQHIDSRVLVAHTRSVTVQEKVHGVPVIRVASYGRAGSVAMCPTFPAWLRHQRADVTVIHEPNPLALAAHFLVKPAGKLVVWYHSEVVRQRLLYPFYRPFLRRALRLADRIIVSSPPLAEQAKELQPFRSKCVVVPFGIDPERLACTPTVAARVAQLRRLHGTPIWLFVGRLVGYKGIEVFLGALRGVPGIAVCIGSGPLWLRLQLLAQRLGIEDRVVFMGEVDDDALVALYHACTALILPSISHNEAFGMVQLEAMACGKPVVSTNLPCSGVPWVNRHEETGLIVPPGSIPALQAALTRLLDDPALCATLGKQGQLRVMTTFTAKAMARRTIELYQRIVVGECTPALSASAW